MTEPATAVLETEQRPATLPVVQTERPVVAMRQPSVVEYAMQNGATAAEVKALVELQIQMDNHKLAMLRQQDEREREERNRLAVLAFRRDFAAFRGENIIVPKTKNVDRGKAGSFVQAEYHVASDLLSPALSKHGFGFRHKPVFGSKPWTTDGVVNDAPWVYVTCYLEHREGHVETIDLEGPPGDLSANTPVQNMQATTSYLKRQSLLAITGTATGGEDDENDHRDRGGRRDDRIDDVAIADYQRLLAEGNAEALRGMPALTDWWGGLTKAQRSLMNLDFGDMRRKAGGSHGR
jgi:hypothetical protein